MAKETIVYNTKGTCCKQMIIDLEDDIIQNIKFIGGCNGNLQGINALTNGMNISEVVKRLKGILCGSKPTSCPDQLATCLAQYISEREKTLTK